MSVSIALLRDFLPLCGRTLSGAPFQATAAALVVGNCYLPLAGKP